MRRLYNRLAVLFLVLSLATIGLAKPWVVAHRGGAGLGAENSLELFRKALDLGVDAIELDIHQSADGHLMVIHDISLRRTHGVDKRVDELDLAALQRYGVPTLQEAIDLVDGRCVLVVEVKHPKGSRHKGIEKRLVKLLAENKLTTRALVISFDTTTLKRIHELEPSIKTGFLYRIPTVLADSAKTEMGVSYLCPHYLLATPSMIKKAHADGLKVNTWTVNEEKVMKRLVESECDTVTTDYPDVLKSVLQEPMLLK
jgi:glycerophosphoryl diester phosphodiesterase